MQPKQFGWRADLAPTHSAALEKSLRADGLGGTLRESAPQLVGNLPAKTTVLHDAAKVALGHYLQPQNQPRGTCTSRGAKRIVDLTQCVMIANGEPLTFKYASHAFLYGIGREHAGMLGGDPNDTNDDGCTGAAMAWAAANAGDLANADDGDDDDSDDLACLWGARGVPADKRPPGLKHRIRRVTGATTFDDVKNAILNGYGATVASDVGFEGIPSDRAFGRDADGRAHRGGTWPHQMCYSGYRADRDWLLVDQSWGPNCPDGPLGSIPIPDYAFWVSREDASAMIAQGDCWIYGGIDGWPADRMHWLV